MARAPRRCPHCNHELLRPGPCPYCHSAPVRTEAVREIRTGDEPDRAAAVARTFWKWAAVAYLFVVLAELVSEAGGSHLGPLRFKVLLDVVCPLVGLYGCTEAWLWIRGSKR
jgi:hypothetical protein